jgi:hypothetical protein
VAAAAAAAVAAVLTPLALAVVSAYSVRVLAATLAQGQPQTVVVASVDLAAQMLPAL